MNRHKARIAWEEVCVPKNEGGLGFMKYEEWNLAASLRHIWNLCNHRNHTLWVSWVRIHLLRNRSIWDISIPQNCTWPWRHILKNREMARKNIKCRIGNGNTTSLWFDNWHPNDPLVCVYGERIIYDAGIAKDAKVSSVIDPYAC